jgi:hypothetical protein
MTGKYYLVGMLLTAAVLVATLVAYLTSHLRLPRIGTYTISPTATVRNGHFI